MAGRGKEATLPAWMQASGGSVPGASASAAASSYAGGSVPRKQGLPAMPTASSTALGAPPRARSRSRERKTNGPRRGSRSRSSSRHRRRHSPSRSPSQSRRRSGEDDSRRGGDRRDRDDSYRNGGSRTRSRSRSRSRSRRGFGPPAGALPPAPATASLGMPPAAAAAGVGLIDTKALIAAAMANAGVASSATQANRPARRLYIGGLGGVAEAEVVTFFNQTVCKVWQPGDHVVGAYINHDKRFGFVEFKDINLCTAALALDGILFKGQPLRLRRPNDYVAMPPPPGPPIVFRLNELGLISNTVPDGPNKVFVGGLPYTLTEESLRELLESYGPLKALHLVRETGSYMSKGYGFFEYANPAVTDAAIQGLNGLPLGDKPLTVRRAETAIRMGGAAVPPVVPGGGVVFGGGSLPPDVEPFAPAAGIDLVQLAMQATAAVAGQGMALPPPPQPAQPSLQPPPLQSAAQPYSRTLRLRNMVTLEDVSVEEEYEDLVADVDSELRRYGAVTALVVPRQGANVGSIFVEYADAAQAAVAAQALSGRRFASRTIETSFEPDGGALAAVGGR